MTPGEFASAVGAGPKWIRNARRMLQRPPRLDEADACWWGLVHALHVSLGVGLREAARIADEVLDAHPDRDSSLSGVEVIADRAGTITVTVDRLRARSLHALRYARAIHMPAFDYRGRPATGYRPMVEAVKRRARRDNDIQTLRLNARQAPADRLAALGPFADMLRELASAGVLFVTIGEVAAALFGALRRPAAVDVIHDPADEASLHALAQFMADCRAAPRGAPRLERHILDARLIGAAGTLALDTSHGALNVFVTMDPIGDYSAALARATNEFGLPVLGLPSLMMVERHAGRTRNRELLFELRELERERQREAARLSRRISRRISRA